jgi:hypothetical protein
MKKVLDITDRLEGKKRRERNAAHRDRIEGIQRIVQCSSCQLRCSLCTRHLDSSEAVAAPPSATIRFTLCTSCRVEFEDFLARKSGDARTDIFWHNREWHTLWSSWMAYQEALQAFRSTPEFRTICEEGGEND